MPELPAVPDPFVVPERFAAPARVAAPARAAAPARVAGPAAAPGPSAGHGAAASGSRPVVVLIGAPGAGKTRLGKRIARILDLPFIDTDKTIVAEHGPISAMFQRHGEAHFRAIEREHVASALGQHAVVALGGGAVLDADTQRELERHRVVQLTVSPEAVLARISNGKRPLVTGVDAWSALVEKRRPVYDRLARRTFDTSSLPIDTIADDIVGWIQEQTA